MRNEILYTGDATLSGTLTHLLAWSLLGWQLTGGCGSLRTKAVHVIGNARCVSLLLLLEPNGLLLLLLLLLGLLSAWLLLPGQLLAGVLPHSQIQLDGISDLLLLRLLLLLLLLGRWLLGWLLAGLLHRSLIQLKILCNLLLPGLWLLG